MRDAITLNTLLERNLIDSDKHRIVVTECERSGRLPLDVLLANNFINESLAVSITAEKLRCRVVDLSNQVPDQDVLAMISGDLARQFQFLPIEFDSNDKSLTLAIADIADVSTLAAIQEEVNDDIRLRYVVAARQSIRTAVAKYYGSDFSVNQLLNELTGLEAGIPSVLPYDNTLDHPVVKLVDAFIQDAVTRNASDIHFEPESGYLRVRYRIDGVLEIVSQVHISVWSACSTRLKVLAHLDIAENRATQDGSFELLLENRKIDVRVSVFPVNHGENIVLRLLDSGSSLISLVNLGFADPAISTIERSIQKPGGVILVVGPTGSGKTTTLYSILQSLVTPEVCIMTLEDPVEYQLPLVRQCAVGGKNRIDFAKGIRSALRQDPDVLLVGEIRDSETAELTFRAAMTGHLVFATVHADSAIGAYQRLHDLGVTRSVAARQIQLVISQRLIRTLCEHCKEPECDPVLPPTIYRTSHWYRSRGCRHCDSRGYTGRQVVAELIEHSAELESALQNNRSTVAVMDLLHRSGFVNLQQNAMELCIAGNTSLSELIRVTGPIPKLNPEKEMLTSPTEKMKNQRCADLETLNSPNLSPVDVDRPGLAALAELDNSGGKNASL